ncbi:MAG TPA: tetratricopeptide repeat protein [Thermoanaerobacterales bacterium]|nr:tetratricopeptide repeat protein [Thermoanaerobacterales bacterium]
MTKKEAYDVLINLENAENKKYNKLNVHFIWTSCLFWIGKYNKALCYIHKISEKNNTVEVDCWKGVLYYFIRDYNNAVYFLEKAENIDPKNMGTKYFLAEVFFAMSNIEKAEARYRALTGNSGFKSIGLYGIGCCLLKTNRLDEALGFFNKALLLAKQADLVKILNKKGLCLMELKIPEEARLCFEECLKYSPSNVMVQLNLALALGKLRKYKEAARIYKNILIKTPHNIIAINNYASCMAACNAYDEALKYCNTGLNIDPSNPDLLINKAYCLYKHGHYNSALECLNEAEKIVKDDIILCNNKALCLIALEKYDDALKLLSKLLDKGSSDDLLFNKAYCLVKKDMYSEALACLTSIKDKNKKNFDFYTLKGICFEKLGNHEAAIESFNKSLIIAG